MIRSKILCVAAVCMAVLAAGCSKKQTKVAPEVEPAPQEEVVEPETKEFVPSDEDVFRPVDMDEQMRQVLSTLYFDYDKWDLRPESIEVLEGVAAFMSENPGVRLLVEGHADERGTNEYNIGLGENRAKAARQYLISYGVEENRLEYTSYGRERPANPNCQTEECHAKNRRVEWKVLAK
ncbi:MAG: OmpA family protein [Chitinivibrionales bacterium]|nr:OmpA family protein [Chitinivibrionales bacterium]MBD3394639.1 OmpA family protein [Chitinivibrionales bacterium]